MRVLNRPKVSTGRRRNTEEKRIEPRAAEIYSKSFACEDKR